MNRRLKTIFFVIVITLVFTGIAYAQTGDEKTASTVVSVLAPLAAAALAIERVMETFWGIIESIKDKFKGENKKETEDWKTDPRYVEFKTWASALLGLIIGVVIAYETNLMMFKLVGFKDINAETDLFITGLVVGSGPKFTHDIIGIFSQGKKLIEQAQELIKRK